MERKQLSRILMMYRYREDSSKQLLALDSFLTGIAVMYFVDTIVRSENCNHIPKPSLKI